MNELPLSEPEKVRESGLLTSTAMKSGRAREFIHPEEDEDEFLLDELHHEKFPLDPKILALADSIFEEEFLRENSPPNDEDTWIS